jgi:hypothetical protein
LLVYAPIAVSQPNGRYPGEAQARIADLAIGSRSTASTADAVPARLKGFTGNPTNTGPFWNVHAWTLE